MYCSSACSENVLFTATNYLVSETNMNSNMTEHSKCALNLSCTFSQINVDFKNLWLCENYDYFFSNLPVTGDRLSKVFCSLLNT